jgi:hypothetical protein
MGFAGSQPVHPGAPPAGYPLLAGLPIPALLSGIERLIAALPKVTDLPLLMGGAGAQKLTAAPISLSVNLNGDQIGKAVSDAIVYQLEHPTSAASPNGLPYWVAPDGRQTDH